MTIEVCIVSDAAIQAKPIQLATIHRLIVSSIHLIHVNVLPSIYNTTVYLYIQLSYLSCSTFNHIL